VRIDKQVSQAVDRLELPFNVLGVDPYGTTKKDLRFWLTFTAAFYRFYFSVKTRGIENVPTRGRAMLVGNHSGGIAIDAAMVVASCLLEMNPPRLA
jgi:1-acyl-sn-glycerol-3-phosphate acyltransferase